jgi:hypothetical protein
MVIPGVPAATAARNEEVVSQSKASGDELRLCEASGSPRLNQADEIRLHSGQLRLDSLLSVLPVVAIATPDVPRRNPNH